ncbi:MAG: aminotransferase class I/II-fold pyridoxal phosphate-dependent enzyme [Chitinophagaceae bacterium]|nr:aminotransferase class I/II-fold pyridoxal phosphate-dependent enzyme [Chitinophagaceae bacterium]
MLVDLRSDTITQPTAGMIDAMRKAITGDDVFVEDPTVNELEKMTAELFGMEAAIYCPTGTMSNQIAIKVHTNAGEEVICDKMAHVYLYEAGGIAFNAGCQVKLIDGNNGKFTAAQVSDAINPDDVHKPTSTLVCLENTANRGGGSCYQLEEINKIRKVVDENKLKLHLDGARLFNALVARKESPIEYGKVFHSISVCLNKGLGCPIGSMLIGPSDFIRKARRIRKVFGGGMRQAGYMAATGIYALKNHVHRLAEDHAHAKQLADAVSKKDFCAQVIPVETNIVIFEVRAPFTAKQVVEKLKAKQILAIAMSATQVRLVLHLDIRPEMVSYTQHCIDKM